METDDKNLLQYLTSVRNNIFYKVNQYLQQLPAQLWEDGDVCINFLEAIETQRKTLQIKFFFQYLLIQDPDTKESERHQSNWFPTKQMYFIGKVHSLQYLWFVSGEG